MGFWARCAAALEADKKAATIREISIASAAANDTTTEETVVRTCSRIRIVDIRHKDWTRFGKKHEGRVLVGHNADIEPKKSIRLHGFEKNHVSPHAYDITFKIGDAAVYDSFNMVYTGEIVAIGEKTVKIREDHGTRIRALDIATFSDRNRGFDLAKINKRNAEWTD